MYQTSWASYVVTEYFGENQSFWCETAMYFIFHNLIILHKWNSIGIVYISSDICFQKPQHFNNIFTEVRPHHFYLFLPSQTFMILCTYGQVSPYMLIWFAVYLDLLHPRGGHHWPPEMYIALLWQMKIVLVIFVKQMSKQSVYYRIWWPLYGWNT